MIVVVVVVVVVVIAVVYPSIYLSVYLSICKLNETILQDFLSFSNLTAPKTRKFCETSSLFAIDKIKNEAIRRDFLRKWQVECRADGLVFVCLRFFQSMSLKYRAFPKM